MYMNRNTEKYLILLLSKALYVKCGGFLLKIPVKALHLRSTIRHVGCICNLAELMLICKHSRFICVELVQCTSMFRFHTLTRTCLDK